MRIFCLNIIWLVVIKSQFNIRPRYNFVTHTKTGHLRNHFQVPCRTFAISLKSWPTSSCSGDSAYRSMTSGIRHIWAKKMLSFSKKNHSWLHEIFNIYLGVLCLIIMVIFTIYRFHHPENSFLSVNPYSILHSGSIYKWLFLPSGSCLGCGCLLGPCKAHNHSTWLGHLVL